MLSLTLSPWLLFAATAPFPRGEGFYFHPAKIILLILLYFLWVRTAWWVSEDCQQVKLSTDLWNPVLLGCGIVGAVVVWTLPFFWASFVALVVLYLAPTLIYVGTRNERVPAEERVLTPRHIREVLGRLFGGKRGAAASGGPKPIPIRFIGKSVGSRQEDPSRVMRAQESRGYRAALEMVHEAILMRATDIHLEPTKDEMMVRFRVDGILHATTPFTRVMGDAVVNIFKVLAELDITEKRKPQDGSFAAEVRGPGTPLGGSRRDKGEQNGEPEEDGEGEGPPPEVTRQVDFRVATAGSVVGEKLVMRILDRSCQVTTLTQVGMRDRMRDQLRSLVTQPHGLLIVCGPTGAGKSTTLYACLEEIDRFQKNVITVENPVEYHIENVTQIEVNPKAGKTFASELRSILRQDPDVIYIGEVRDQETAEIACQAAQTGHMVFTTLHANDTITALGRLLDLGVQPFMVASAVSAVLGQRLVRLLCPKCKQRYKPNAEMLRKANLPADKIKYFYRPTEKGEGEEAGSKGVCPQCAGTGYYGRTGVFELLVITDRVRDLVRENPNLNAIKQEAIRCGMKHLQEEALRLVIGGETSIQEILRVCK